MHATSGPIHIAEMSRTARDWYSATFGNRFHVRRTLIHASRNTRGMSARASRNARARKYRFHSPSLNPCTAGRSWVAARLLLPSACVPSPSQSEMPKRLVSQHHSPVTAWFRHAHGSSETTSTSTRAADPSHASRSRQRRTRISAISAGNRPTDEGRKYTHKANAAPARNQV